MYPTCPLSTTERQTLRLACILTSRLLLSCVGDRPAVGGAELGVGPVGGGELEPGGGKHIMPRRLVRGRGEAGVPQPCAKQHILVASKFYPHLFIDHEQPASTANNRNSSKIGREVAG